MSANLGQGSPRTRFSFRAVRPIPHPVTCDHNPVGHPRSQENDPEDQDTRHDRRRSHFRHRRPSGRADRTGRPAPPPPTYVVEIKTGCLSKSGTDANVQISLLGSGYSFGKFLDNPGVNDFENGRTDSYRFVGWDLGDVSQIHLGHDNTGGSPGWLVRTVRIYNFRTGKWSDFPVHRWLA